MNMKKNFKYLLMAVAVVGLSLNFIACTDDEKDVKDSGMVIDKDVLKYGIEVDASMQTAGLSVSNQGLWIAIIDDGDNAWVRIEREKLTYKGSQTLKLFFKENTDGADRRANLQLYDLEGNDPVTIDIRQKGAGTNAGKRTSGVIYQGQGLGHGVVIDYFLNTDLVQQNQKNKPESFSISKAIGNNSVYDLAVIQEKVNENKGLRKIAYEETSNNVYELLAQLVDSTVSQHKNFEASVNMSASFGFIEFEAAVAYQAQKSQNSAHVDYTISRYAPLYEVRVSPAEIVSYAVDESAEAMIDYDDKYDELTEEVTAKYGGWKELQAKKPRSYEGYMKKLNKYRPDFGGVFSDGFSMDLWGYYKAIIEKDTAKAIAALENIDESYSPFVITGGTWGGSMNVFCRIDTMRMFGKDSLYASLSVDLSSLGSVSGEVSLSSEGMDLLRNAGLKIGMYGGDPTIGDGIVKWLLSSDVTSYREMQQLLKDWVLTMKSPADPEADEKTAASPIEYTFTPIWMIMDPDYRQFARNWFYDRYRGSTVLDFFGYCENPRDKWPKSPSQLLGSQD